MSTPVSVSQITKLLEVLGNPSREEFQYLLANGDLLKAMVGANLHVVDRSAFKAALRSPVVPSWRPVSEYAEKISEWNTLRNWGLSETQIATFSDTLVDHHDTLNPTGISLWLGRNLQFNWEEAMFCIKHEIEAIGMKSNIYIDAKDVSFLPGSEQTGEPELTVALLDLESYGDPTDSISAGEVREIEGRLPGLEVAWLLVLNPRMFVSINYDTILGFVAAGLLVGAGERTVDFSYGSEGAIYIDNGWVDSPNKSRTIVRFRK